MTISVQNSSRFRFFVAAAALLASMGVFMVAGSGVAVAKKLPKAVGIANCPIYSGSGTVNPGLTPAGSPGGVKINFTASLTSPAGGPCGNSSITSPAGVTIVGGTVTGSGYYKSVAGGASSCAKFDGVDVVGKIRVTDRVAHHPARCHRQHHHRLHQQPGDGERCASRHNHTQGSPRNSHSDRFVLQPQCGQHHRSKDRPPRAGLRSRAVFHLHYSRWQRARVSDGPCLRIDSVG